MLSCSLGFGNRFRQISRILGFFAVLTLGACSGETSGGGTGPGATLPGPTSGSSTPMTPGPKPNVPTPSEPSPSPSPTPAQTGGNTQSPNLFASLLSKSDSEVSAKVKTAVDRFFGLAGNESSTPSADNGYRCYYELPQDSSQAFIWAADSDDVRSEGMSFGMMIAVQTDLHDQFDKLWRFAQQYMQYGASAGAWAHYFKWQGKVTTNGNNWSVSFGDSNVPAPDGDEYFAAALYLADQRWGSSGGINYKQEADNIATAFLHNSASNDGRFPIIHQRENKVVFVPYGGSNEFTDPSYHLPALYELFALLGPSTDADKWRTIADTSRKFLVSAANSSTGLHPDYAKFDGSPTTQNGGDGHDKFQYDAWRVVMNMAWDYAWFSNDSSMKAQVEKYHSFFAGQLSGNNVKNSLFALDGSGATGGGSTALTGTLAAGAMASDSDKKQTFVSNLWSIDQQQGRYRYYQECLYLLSLLHVSGTFRYAW
jgi:oligosaccharide reducing-end xylanase